ncbi:hypothetical protein GCM10023210_31120 [Chryseobacterium ginsengisoli]|uniref:Uncharacterized protein n=1 Tax=Chryseobacterium ginsengisoli TaxID=363853 RepID=A0ABP9MHT8_9FLAO
MNNKEIKFEWSDVQVHLLGKKIDVKPLEYTNENSILVSRFEGTLNISKNEFDSLFVPKRKEKKLSNFQLKKLFKKFKKNLENNQE